MAAAVFLLAVLSVYQTAVLPLLATGMKGYYRAGDRAVNLMLSIGLPLSVLSCFGTGWLIQRLGARRVLRFAAWALAISAGLAAASGGWWAAMFLAVAMVSACFDSISLTSQVYLTSLFPDHRRGILSGLAAAIAIGGIVFPLCVQGLLAWDDASAGVSFTHVLRGPYVVIALGMMLGGLALRSGTFDARSAPPAPRPRGAWRLSHGSLYWVASAVLMSAGDAMTSLWLPQVLDTPAFRVELGWLKPGYVMSLFVAAYLLTRTALAAIPDRIGPRVFLWMPALVGGAVFAGGVLTRDPATVVVTLVIGALLWSAQMPTLMAVLAEREGERFAGVAALKMVLGSLLGFGCVNALAWWAEGLDAAARWKTLLVPATTYTLAGLIAASRVLAEARRAPRPPIVSPIASAPPDPSAATLRPRSR